MLKPLLKKQALEIGNAYFRRKGNKATSRTSTVGMVFLFVFLYLILSLSFFMIAEGFVPLIDAGLHWLFYALVGTMTVFFGVFITAFGTYNGLFRAKDNDLLLSMPIRPAEILASRLIGTLGTSFLFSAIIFVPAVIVFLTRVPVTPWLVISPIIVLLLISFLSLTLACAIGWLIGLLTAKLKNKSYVTVVFSLLFLGLYYFLNYKITGLIDDIASNAAAYEKTFSTALYPLKILGLAAAGDITGLVLLAVAVALLFGLTVLVLAKTFSRIATETGGGKKAVYRVRSVTQNGIDRALLSKERKRFTSSPTYLLNAGLGILLTVAAAVAMAIKKNDFFVMIGEVSADVPSLGNAVPVLFAGLFCLLLSTVTVSAPSVSLEGKHYWLTRSLPVTTEAILRAKYRLHFLLAAVPAAVCTLAVGLYYGLGLTAFVMVLPVVAFAAFCAVLGLWLDLKRPNLTWTNEVVPIKQSLSVGIALLLSLLLAVLLTLPFFAVAGFLPPWVWLLGETLIVSATALLLRRRILTDGVKRYEAL